jgi:hypothetical protein
VTQVSNGKEGAPVIARKSCGAVLMPERDRATPHKHRAWLFEFTARRRSEYKRFIGLDAAEFHLSTEGCVSRLWPVVVAAVETHSPTPGTSVPWRHAPNNAIAWFLDSPMPKLKKLSLLS